MKHAREMWIGTESGTTHHIDLKTNDGVAKALEWIEPAVEKHPITVRDILEGILSIITMFWLLKLIAAFFHLAWLFILDLFEFIWHRGWDNWKDIPQSTIQVIAGKPSDERSKTVKSRGKTS